MDRDEMLRVLRAFDRRDSSTWEGAVRPLDRSDAEALRREFDLEDE